MILKHSTTPHIDQRCKLYPPNKSNGLLFQKRVHPLMPCGIMAIFAVICGILFFFLPETYNQAMPDTVQQVDSTRESEVESNGKVKDDEKIQSNDIKQPIMHLANV